MLPPCLFLVASPVGHTPGRGGGCTIVHLLFWWRRTRQWQTCGVGGPGGGRLCGGGYGGGMDGGGDHNMVTDQVLAEPGGSGLEVRKTL